MSLNASMTHLIVKARLQRSQCDAKLVSEGPAAGGEALKFPRKKSPTNREPSFLEIEGFPSYKRPSFHIKSCRGPKGPFPKVTCREIMRVYRNFKNGCFLVSVCLVTFYIIPEMFAENQNGPYGPWQPFLQYGIGK